MSIVLNDGYCPECQLNNEDVRLMLNKDDFWECPKSNLQLAGYGVDAAILKFRGTGKFKDTPIYGTDEICGAVLSRTEGDSILPSESFFNSLDDFKNYLLNEVEPNLKLSLENLAITYINFKYGGGSYLPFKRQSKNFKIDFENQSILRKLEKRDAEEGMLFQQSYTHLYSLLVKLFQHYYNGNIDWLPEMGMSQNQVALCNKHLHNAPEPITHIIDKDIIKPRLLNFIVDLIEIIYCGKQISTSFNQLSKDTAVTSYAEQILTLQEILNLKTNLFNNAKVKLVRHKDSRKEYRELIKDKAKLLEYQREQSKEVFKDCDYIISFIGQEGTKSLLFGIFKVNGVEKLEDSFYYNLEQVHDIDSLVDRVVIDWGDNAIAWHQWYHKQPKEIVQILPKGYLGSFPGLLNFVLDFEELVKLVQNPDANQDWKNHLSAVNGIYVILDSRTGEQYIGSACGENGIWQRWSDYAKTFHGGNKKLIELCQKESEYYKNFRFSILQSLPSNITKKEIVAIEYLYMQKLGTRANGLN
ncbi:GIY-YIG nuclease family protein [Adhaeribacter aquaticus]|uniref:GIY-YIG nuclease family protein n=1 Tax=Adhaeribacter aquaticus TaxID=299567 RepID=UPI00041A2451|nr:GIY-YIG nuclease family protein [Adhaeribacter aquaticus]